MKLTVLEEVYGSLDVAIEKLKEQIKPSKDMVTVQSYVVMAHYRRYPHRRKSKNNVIRLRK